MPTLEMLQPYVGGVIEMQDFNHKGELTHLSKGPIKSIEAQPNGKIAITMEWCGRAIGLQHLSTHWVNDHRLDFSFAPEVHSAHQVGTRLALRCPHFGMKGLTTLSPPSETPRLARTDVHDKVILFMDDLREAPPGALVARTPEDTEHLFRHITGMHALKIDELWLDHDLGEDAEGNVVDIMPLVTMLEEAAAHGRLYDIGVIYVHSDNSPRRDTILRSLKYYGYNCRISNFR